MHALHAQYFVKLRTNNVNAPAVGAMHRTSIALYSESVFSQINLLMRRLISKVQVDLLNFLHGPIMHFFFFYGLKNSQCLNAGSDTLA
jgi:hypothetical protein